MEEMSVGNVSKSLNAMGDETRVTTAINRVAGDLDHGVWSFMSAASGAVRCTLLHPLNLAQARMQVSEGSTPSLRRTLGNVFRQPRFRDVYRGWGPSLWNNTFGEVVYIMSVEHLRALLTFPRKRELSSLTSDQDEWIARETTSASRGSFSDASLGATIAADVMSGIAADALVSIFCTPALVVANRQMSAGVGLGAGRPYRSVFSTALEVWHATPRRADGTALHRLFSGIRGFYVGLSASILNTPVAGVWWGTYRQFSRGYYALARRVAQRECDTPRPRVYRGGGDPKTFPPRQMTTVESRDLGETPRGDGKMQRHSDEASSVTRNGRKERYEDKRDALSSATSVTSPLAVLASSQGMRSVEDNPLINSVAGMSASAVAAICATPLAVLQTRVQSARVASTAFSATTRPLRAALHSLLREEGAKGLTKGMSAAVLNAMLSGLLFSTTLEMSKLSSDRTKLATIADNVVENEG